MIRFVKASPIYDSFLDEFYNDFPEMVNANYDTQLENIFKQCIGWSDFWKINLEKTQKFQVYEIITNAKILQQRWAFENGISFTEENWMQEILEAQLNFIKPEIFFAHDYIHFSIEWIMKIKNDIPSISFIIGYDGFGLGNSERFRGFNLILSCAKFICDFYKANNYNVFFMPYSFEPQILKHIELREPRYSVSFAGSIIVKDQFHNNRLRILSRISEDLNISLWAASMPQSKFPITKDQLLRLKDGKFQEFYDVCKLSRINNGASSGIKMYQILSDSRFTLNNHIDVSGNIAGNSRLTEATGVGTCLVTDWKSNLEDFFKIDEEVIAYKTPEEAIDKIKYLQNNENERIKIAKAGQKRTLTEHSFEIQINRVIEQIEKLY
jgi:spore maturation protein CgeB